MKKIPNVHNNWGKLKEVWLGDVWPAHFYDDLDPEIRDSWYQITEWTKEDLTIIENKLKELGVNVLRPYVDGPKENYISKIPPTLGKLVKPPITPRDSNAVVGNKLFLHSPELRAAYDPLLDQYDPSCIFMPPSAPAMSGADTVKLGRDIIIDKWLDGDDKNDIKKVKRFVFEMFQVFQRMEGNFFGSDYRLHFATQGGHCDGCFMPLRKGLLISTEYYKDYEMMFPDWEKIVLANPTYHSVRHGNVNSHRWLIPGMGYKPHFNEYIEKFCPEWIGNFKETYFEVNILVIDEKNILCMGEHGRDNPILDDLERRGITCHIVPFRTRTFWDGGLHCITLDTIREGTLEDYYPERGGYGIKTVASKYFDYSEEKFYKEYNHWLATGEITE